MLVKIKDRCHVSLNLSSFLVGKRDGSFLVPRRKIATNDKRDESDAKVDESMPEVGVENGAAVARLVTLYNELNLILKKLAWSISAKLDS